jgi:large subunit ribosomal protein L4
LSQKNRDGEIMFIDKLSMDTPKTKTARTILETLSKISGFEMLLAKKKNSALILNPEMNENNLRSFSNFQNIKTEEMRKINPLDLLTYKYLVIVNPAESLELLTDKLTK